MYPQYHTHLSAPRAESSGGHQEHEGSSQMPPAFAPLYATSAAFANADYLSYGLPAQKRRRVGQDTYVPGFAGGGSFTVSSKGPCVQCAQAGVSDTCSQNRRTIGCVRCNAHRLGCSFRAGEPVPLLASPRRRVSDVNAAGVEASTRDLEVPDLVHSIQSSLALLMDHSRVTAANVEAVTAQVRQSEVALHGRMRALQEEMAELKSMMRQKLTGEAHSQHTPAAPPGHCPSPPWGVSSMPSPLSSASADHLPPPPPSPTAPPPSRLRKATFPLPGSRGTVSSIPPPPWQLQSGSVSRARTSEDHLQGPGRAILDEASSSRASRASDRSSGSCYQCDGSAEGSQGVREINQTSAVQEPRGNVSRSGARTSNQGLGFIERALTQTPAEQDHGEGRGSDTLSSAARAGQGERYELLNVQDAAAGSGQPSLRGWSPSRESSL